MRSLPLSLLLALAPAGAGAQPFARSIGLETGFAHDSAARLGGRVPLALTGGWWLVGELDVTVRVSWGFALRTDGRGTDGPFEAGAGLRYSLPGWGELRPQLSLAASYVLASGPPGIGASDGVRLEGGVGLEAFVTRELAVALFARASALWLDAEGWGHGFGGGLGLAYYF